MSELNTVPESAFTFVKDDGTRIVSFCCDVALYTGEDLSSIPDSVLHIYDRYLAVCSPERIKWYSTENMTRHKPVTHRVLNMLRGWLKPGAPSRKTIYIDLKDGASFDDAPEYSFEVFGCEIGELGYGEDANAIRCTFPGRWGVDHADLLLNFAADACAVFPFMSGHAGFVLETSPYYKVDGEVTAWQMSMKHPGLDISNSVTDPVALGRDGIKGVNWLTMLGPEFADRIGGASAMRQVLPKSVTILSAGNGVILQAGPVPCWGNVNRQDLLPDYRAVYKLVAPLQDPIVQRYTSFSLPGGDHKEKTTAWLRRFADGA